MPVESATPPDDENQWIVISCPGCDREIKLPREAEEDISEMACPYCSANLGGKSDDSGSPEGQDEPRKRRGAHSGAAGADKAPEWDTDAMPVDEDENLSEYVEVDPNTPGGVRVRRVRRKRTLTPAEKVVRTLAIGFGCLAAVVGLAVIIIAIVKGTGTATHDVQVAAELPNEIKKLISAARANEKIPPVLTEAETKAAEAIVRGYLEANGWKNKVLYVHEPQRAAFRMEEWYQRSENSDIPVRVGPILKRDKIFDEGRAIIKIAIETNLGDYQIFALRQTLNDIKIDWESSVGYQQMSLGQFQNTRPTEPVPFRVYVQPDNYYNFEFSDRQIYQCFLLTYPGTPDFKIYAYAKRESPELENFFKRAQTQKFSGILTLRYPEGSVAENQAEIIELVSGSWFE